MKSDSLILYAMKIVVNTRSLITNKLDGIGWFTFQTLKRITQTHPEVEFTFLFDRPYSEEFIFGSNIKPVVLFPPARHPFLYWIYYQWSVKNILQKIKPDLFLAPDGLLSLGAKCKQLAVVHDINFLHYPKDLKYFYSKYYNFFVPKFVREANRIATVSEFSKQDMVESYRVDPSKIDVVYNGINEGYKPISESEKTEVRIKYSDGKPYFIFVGSQSPRKNLIRLIKAFDQFKKATGAPHQLVLAGAQFWGEVELNDALENCKHRSEIHFTGRLAQSELEKVMAAAFALTFVSYFEGFGIPLIEAMACEVPILCSKVSCMPEIVGNAGLWVDPFQVEDISRGMIQLSQSPDLVKDLVQKGLERKNEFSWDKSAVKLWQSILTTLK